jgi:hypothetical protein
MQTVTGANRDDLAAGDPNPTPGAVTSIAASGRGRNETEGGAAVGLFVVPHQGRGLLFSPLAGGSSG